MLVLRCAENRNCLLRNVSLHRKTKFHFFLLFCCNFRRLEAARPCKIYVLLECDTSTTTMLKKRAVFRWKKCWDVPSSSDGVLASCCDWRIIYECVVSSLCSKNIKILHSKDSKLFKRRRGVTEKEIEKDKNKDWGIVKHRNK